MPFSSASENKKKTCHHEIQIWLDELIKRIDFTIIQGSRSDAEQQKAFKEGKSKLDGIINKSKHQTTKEKPYSEAVDMAKNPINWNYTQDFIFFAGFALAVADELYRAKKMTRRIRWGGDWDSDKDFKDNKFNDYLHFELV